MADDRTFFFPGTAECQPIVSEYPYFIVPSPNHTSETPNLPNNTMGGYGGLSDLKDYNGSTGNANLFVKPDDVGNSAGITDLMPKFCTAFNINTNPVWYLMRRTDFKNWIGVDGIFWRVTSFTMEIDVSAVVSSFGGFRSEAPNQSLGFPGSPRLYGITPYNPGPQGNGVKLEAVITDSLTHLEVVKDSKTFDGSPALGASSNLVFPRQIVQLSLASVKPEEMATMVLRVTTEQFFSNHPDYAPFLPNDYSPVDLSSTIYRIGLTPDPASLRSSGKQSATLTTR